MNAKALTLLSLSLSTVGCAALLKSGMVKDGTNYAENPITSGQPLALRQKGDVGVVSEPDCRTWPFEDVFTVTASEREICVEFNRHDDLEMSIGEPPESLPLRVEVDGGAGPTEIEATRVGHAKVSQCMNKGYGKQVDIWNTSYRGCAVNNGNLTATSTYLTVGNSHLKSVSFKLDDRRWTFRAKDAAPGAEPGAATAAAR